MLTLGSHFDGIAGFPLAAAGNGIEVVWATEIEPFPIVVSKAHFPNMKHYGNITDVSGAELEPVDIITFGSPCQDLSVAGKRAGLEGERSGLFMEAVRTIREMRDATSGIYPRIAVWENVPGAMSSNNGADFRAVLEELLEAEVPVPRSGKWANAGLVRGNGREIAWRILDAQYWGVPQRRRRIFLICDFTGECAGEILFERQGVSGDSQESGKAGQETAGGTGDGTETAGRYWDGGDISDTFSRSDGGGGRTGVGYVAQLYDMTHAEEVMRPVKPGLAPTLNARMGTGGNQIPVLMEPIAYGPGGQGKIGHALRSQPSKADKPSSTTYVVEPVAFAVRTAQTGANGHAVAHSVDCRNLCENKDLSGKLQCKSNGGHSLNYQNPVRIGYLVRRLTPTECERLQGFPDNWTDVHDMQLTGRKNCLSSDTARYKALGNSVAIPCVRWIMRRIKEQIEELQDEGQA